MLVQEQRVFMSDYSVRNELACVPPSLEAGSRVVCALSASALVSRAHRLSEYVPELCARQVEMSIWLEISSSDF